MVVGAGPTGVEMAGQIAELSRRTLKGNLRRIDPATTLAGKPTGQPFQYRDKGSMATISRFRAVCSIGRLHFSGVLAWVAWLAVHLVYITAFKSRVTTLLHWAVSFVGRGRAERTATVQQVLARTTMARAAGSSTGTKGASIGATSQPVAALGTERAS